MFLFKFNLNNSTTFMAKSVINKIFTRNSTFLPRRALMYVPGDDERKLTKALTIDVDCIAMDCEDGVAINKKQKARETIKKVLDNGKTKKQRDYDWGIRVNSVESGLCAEDLKILLTAKNLPDTVSLPKVENPDHIKWFSDQTNNHITDLSKSTQNVNLIIYIESAIAMTNLPDILKTARLLSQQYNKFTPVALLFGSDDYCASIGATRTDSCLEILYARQKLVMYAKAFNLQAIDMVYIQYKDLDGLRKQSEEGARMGYTGKQVIHPMQVPVVQQAFLPTRKQLEWAEGLLKAFDDHQKSGKGAFNFKGSMIDMPTMKQAQNILNMHKIR